MQQLIEAKERTKGAVLGRQELNGNRNEDVATETDGTNKTEEPIRAI